MDAKTVLVTGIGGNVGQGILRNIRSLDLPVKVIGCDIASFSPGNHLCEKVFQVPYSYDANYIPAIKQIVAAEGIDMIIPSTDYEIFYLAANRAEINAFIMASDADITEKFLDKYLTFELFTKEKIPFAKSWLPKDYDNSEEKIIAKPRKGRGSRGIIINPKDILNLGDDYMIQPLHEGIEITTAIYFNRTGAVHGIFSLERELTNGTTSKTIVNNSYNNQFEKMADKMVKLGGIRGSVNVQSIIDDHGIIHPFEINCRISGTNSIRHHLGFQDVKYALQEYLFNEAPDPVDLKKGRGIATRILMDVIYPEASGFNDIDNSSNHIIY